MSISTAKENVIKRISIAIIAVLSAFLILCAAYYSGRRYAAAVAHVGAGESAVREIVRIVGSEMTAAQSRDNAYYYAFVDSGGRGSEYPSVEAEVELDILCITDDTVSFAVETTLPDSSPYGRTVYYNIEQSSGEHVTLADILGDGWRKVLIGCLIPQVKSDPEVYEGIDVIPMINEDRMFYLEEEDLLTVVFDTGEIAPDSVGIKKYRVPLK